MFKVERILYFISVKSTLNPAADPFTPVSFYLPVIQFQVRVKTKAILTVCLLFQKENLHVCVALRINIIYN